MLNYGRNIVKSALAYTPAMQYRKSFALNDLDKKLEPFIGRKNGVFIEAGANNGIRQSNTLYYEKYFGWKGILIEPIPELYQQCKINRPQCNVVNAALVANDYPDETVEMTFCGLMSTTAGAMNSEIQRETHIESGRRFLSEIQDVYNINVKARTLSSILDAFGIKEIDLLSLDIEGYEPMAMMGLDLTRHSPKFLLIEVRHIHREEIDHILEKTHHPIAQLTMLDDHSDVLYAIK
ncbi:MAG: FkbM family methyltransferase [Planctomycetaceae bacterium]|nr:FkbM family methyltransferase [Planctomycetaceae bacterium]